MASEAEIVNEYFEEIKKLPHNQNNKDSSKELKISHKKIVWCETWPKECNCNGKFNCK